MKGRVVVLGGEGFIGARLVGELERRFAGRVVAPRLRQLDLLRADSVGKLARLLDPRGALVMLATAARGKDPRELLRREGRMARNVVAALGRRPVGRCVYFSTTSVYGEVRSARCLRETSPLAPRSPYGIAKLGTERALDAACAALGIPLLVLRPAMVYGPGDHGRAYGPGRFLRGAVESGTVELFGDGAERRDYVHVDDLARIVAALLRDKRTGVFNVGTGGGHSPREIVCLVSAALGREVRVVRLPRKAPKVDLGLDVSRLRAALPRFRFIPFEVGIRRACRGHALAARAGARGTPR